ncbi:MAG: DMT family transporter [Clostridiales bacterium]|nr:DMT family transporter [Clostridiales bacterium]
MSEKKYITGNRRTSAMIAGILGNSIFGCSFLASKVALRYTQPSVLLTVRFGLSLLILSALAMLNIGKLNLRGKNLAPLIALGICQPVLYFLCENYGIMYSTSAFSGIMIGLVPVAASILAVFLLKETLPFRSIPGILSCMVGVAVISLSEKSEGTVTVAGFLFLCGAIFMAAFYNILSKRFSEEFSPFERTYVMFAVGFVSFLVVSAIQTRGEFLTQCRELLTQSDFMMAVLYLAVLSSVIAFFCLNYAVSYLSVRQATSYTNLTPVISVLAGTLFLSEPFTRWHFVGMVLILVGIFRVQDYQQKS